MFVWLTRAWGSYVPTLNLVFAGTRPRTPPVRPSFEPLEDRCVPAVLPLYYSIDGTGNNLAHLTWGAAGSDLLRLAPAAYADGAAAPAGPARPSPRLISDTVAAQTTDVPNHRSMSDWVYGWGQFLDHDIDLTPPGSTPFNVPVPTGDPFFDPSGTGTQVIYFNRSQFDPATGTSTSNPRQQPNAITAFIDGSVVYGADPTRAAALRTFSGGKLLTSAGDLLPFNTAGLPNANDAHIFPNSQLFLAGDVRANENSELSAIQTLFVREHNRLANLMAQADPTLTDEQIYQRARQIVVAEIQVITYKEFLPALLGSNALKPYTGYKRDVNPGIATEFSTAAYRVGHTLLNGDIKFLDNSGTEIQPAVNLRDAFFNPTVLEQAGIDPILKYLATDTAQEVDTKVIDDVRNFLFGPPGAGGLDLASLNIQRGRDHGLADYNTTRAAYGLPKVTSFAQITSDPTLQAKLQQLYGNVNNIDLWVGGLAEDHVSGASVGPTFQRIMVDQFERLRDGDRFWYARIFSGADLATLEHTTLADILKRNTTITNLQDNVFFFHANTISGHVFLDNNHDGQRDPGEAALAGILVKLEDSAGAVIATTRTDARGVYTFRDVTPGRYQVREVLPSSLHPMSGNPLPVVLTEEGGAVFEANFGNSLRSAFGRSGKGLSAMKSKLA